MEQRSLSNEEFFHILSWICKDPNNKLYLNNIQRNSLMTDTTMDEKITTYKKLFVVQMRKYAGEEELLIGADQNPHNRETDTKTQNSPQCYTISSMIGNNPALVCHFSKINLTQYFPTDVKFNKITFAESLEEGEFFMKNILNLLTENGQVAFQRPDGKNITMCKIKNILQWRQRYNNLSVVSRFSENNTYGDIFEKFNNNLKIKIIPSGKQSISNNKRVRKNNNFLERLRRENYTFGFGFVPVVGQKKK